MKNTKKRLSFYSICLFAAFIAMFMSTSAYALLIDDDALGQTPVIIEAENGDMGIDIFVDYLEDTTFVTTEFNFSGATAPEEEERTITYEVTFEDSGYYNLFARLFVNSGAWDDDSFFFARSFGVKDPELADDWVLVNGLAGGGFASPDDFVDEMGSLGSEVWKWVNVSKNFHESDSMHHMFFVDKENLVQTFQIASREDGLYIDKLAFGKANLYFTVDALNNGLPGSLTGPEPAKVYAGPQLAEGASKFLGNVMSNGDTTFANYWNQLTPGNEGKWASVAGSTDTTQWNWSALDYLYNYAKNNNLIFKNHTLIWGNQQPSWINDMDSDEQYRYIETWIKMVGDRYPDTDMIDVVNEPLASHNPPDGNNDRANYKDALGGDGETGWDWVITSFELARKYLPNTELILNDYGIINDNNSTINYLKIINLLKDRGLIDAIGVQGHRFALERTSLTTLTNNLDRLAETGLPIYISELDLGNLDNEGAPDDDVQLGLYQSIFPVLWGHPGVKGITLWGFREGEMWQTTCHLVLSDGTWRPALEWMAQYVKAHPNSVEQATGHSPSVFGLKQNYPNPFNPTTNISYDITETCDVTLKIFDVQGREIQTLVNSTQQAGQYTVVFNAQNLPTGVYFYKLNAGKLNAMKKLLLVK